MDRYFFTSDGSNFSILELKTHFLNPKIGGEKDDFWIFSVQIVRMIHLKLIFYLLLGIDDRYLTVLGHR